MPADLAHLKILPFNTKQGVLPCSKFMSIGHSNWPIGMHLDAWEKPKVAQNTLYDSNFKLLKHGMRIQSLYQVYGMVK